MAFPWTLLSLLISAAHAYTCYDTNGTDVGVSYGYVWTACNTTATVSTCCSETDYCLSNGLCFQASTNNLIATEGCTDPNWASPCYAFCKGFGNDGNVLFPCQNLAGLTASYCCGTDTSCCTNGRAFAVPVGTIVLRPNDHSTSSSSSTLSTTSSSSPTSTSTSSFIPSVTAASTSSSIPSNSTDSKSLAIGLGVGVPLGLALIGAFVFMGWELRRYNDNRSVPTSQGNLRQPETSVRFTEQMMPVSTSDFMGNELLTSRGNFIGNELDATRNSVGNELYTTHNVHELPY